MVNFLILMGRSLIGRIKVLAKPIEFLFDFSSPYGYLAAHRIDAIGQKHNREVKWRPFLLGAMFQINGQRPLKEQVLKWDYSSHDIERTARRYGIEWELPEVFPIPTHAAGWAFYWINEQDEELAKQFALLVYQRYFTQGLDIRSKNIIGELAMELGLGTDACLRAIDSDIYKEKLKTVTSKAIERKVCGSPFIFVGNEPFWGHDRLDMVDEWLQTDGW